MTSLFIWLVGVQPIGAHPRKFSFSFASFVQRPEVTNISIRSLPMLPISLRKHAMDSSRQDPSSRRPPQVNEQARRPP